MNMATRVMIIEDDIAIAELHHKYLSQLAGLDVVGIATTRLEAEMQLEVLKPDLLLMDVYLPDGTGLEILNTLRSNNQTCDVILITAARDVDTLQQAMRGGVVDYLLKTRHVPTLGKRHLKNTSLSANSWMSRKASIKVWLTACCNQIQERTVALNACLKG
ncbi:response regulator [Vibrio parahaemolyticus]|nr:response regulator [Vibrio parahaemolyticus]